jgi:hypothetical protein
VVAHAVALEHVVAREAPLTKITDDEPPAPAAKPAPCTSSGKLSTGSAVALDGSIASIVGPLVIAMAAEADFVESAALVALMATPFGDGAVLGAEYKPVALTDPQAAPAQPVPGTPL